MQMRFCVSSVFFFHPQVGQKQSVYFQLFFVLLDEAEGLVCFPLPPSTKKPTPPPPLSASTSSHTNDLSWTCMFKIQQGKSTLSSRG